MSVLTVADLTVDELKELIREIVTQTILELMADPDSGLELKEQFEVELRRSFNAMEAGVKARPAEDVAERLGLRW